FPTLRQLTGRNGGYLSGGEQQMLTIARTLMGNPELLLLDEPSEGLAPLVVDHLGEQIARLKAEGLTILLAAQNTEFSLRPADRALATQPPTTTAFIERYEERGRAAGRTPRAEWRWVPYGTISLHLKRAVLVAEDIGFYHHHGFAPGNMRVAMTEALEERKIPRGASTVTQQLAKNLWLTPSRSPLRKAREGVLPWQPARPRS